MRLVLTDDLELVRNTYIEVIDNTPLIYQHARWEYGKHPTDGLIREHISRGEMYLLKDGEEVAGMVVVAMNQREDYSDIKWGVALADDEVATVHMLCIRPSYRGRRLGTKILEEVEDLSCGAGKKAIRLDVLQTNLPAKKMYEQAGYIRRGEASLTVDINGVLDFYYYEKVIVEKDC